MVTKILKRLLRCNFFLFFKNFTPLALSLFLFLHFSVQLPVNIAGTGNYFCPFFSQPAWDWRKFWGGDWTGCTEAGCTEAGCSEAGCTEADCSGFTEVDGCSMCSCWHYQAAILALLIFRENSLYFNFINKKYFWKTRDLSLTLDNLVSF